MSMVNFSVMTVLSGLIVGWNDAARRPVVSSRAPASHDLAAVAVFCVVGLIATLVFFCLVPDSLSDLIALIP